MHLTNLNKTSLEFLNIDVTLMRIGGMTAVQRKDCSPCLHGMKDEIISTDDERTIYRLGQTDGEAMLTVYPVFQGIDISYYDVHAGLRVAERAGGPGIIEICHCREGRIEYQCGDEYYFLAPGDLSIARCDIPRRDESFPMGHYHGITVTIDTRRAPDCLSCLLEDVTVCPRSLAEKFCSESPFYVTRSSREVRHIFSELYSVPDQIRKGYFKVKILELFLFLSALPIEQPETRSYSAAQIELAKSISTYLLENEEGKCTMQDLSRQFAASGTLISKSFRGVYGMSPAAYLRAQKMHSAAALLRSTDRTVLDIAGQFGYDNASKFAKAFRDVIGVPPNAYRNGVEQDSCAPSAD